jgi:hypothetical protein
MDILLIFGHVSQGTNVRHLPAIIRGLIEPNMTVTTPAGGETYFPDVLEIGQVQLVALLSCRHQKRLPFRFEINITQGIIVTVNKRGDSSIVANRGGLLQRQRRPGLVYLVKFIKVVLELVRKSFP